MRSTTTRSCWAAVITLALGSCQPHAAVIADPLPATDASSNATAHPDASRENRRVLTTLSAAPFSYELSVLHREPEQAQRDVERFQSDGGSDPFSVRLLKGDRVMDELLLFQSSCGQATVHPVDGVRGGDSDAASWATQYDTCDTRLAARTVKLSAEVTALLLTQASGYEYRFSKHFLYAVQGEKLRTIWTFSDDTTGLDRSSTSVLCTDAAGRQDIAFIHEQRSHDGDPAAVTAQRLRFEGALAQPTVTPLPDEHAPLYVLVLGDFRDLSSARRMSRACLDQVYLFERSVLPQLQAPAFYFGAVFATHKDADTAAASLRECPDLPPSRVFELRFVQGGARATAQ